MRFTPNGVYVISASADKTICVCISYTYFSRHQFLHIRGFSLLEMLWKAADVCIARLHSPIKRVTSASVCVMHSHEPLAYASPRRAVYRYGMSAPAASSASCAATSTVSSALTYTPQTCSSPPPGRIEPHGCGPLKRTKIYTNPVPAMARCRRCSTVRMDSMWLPSPAEGTSSPHYRQQGTQGCMRSALPPITALVAAPAAWRPSCRGYREQRWGGTRCTVPVP